MIKFLSFLFSVCLTGIAFSGPLIINKGGAYRLSANYYSSPGILVTTTDPVIFDGCCLVGYGEFLVENYPNANLTFRNCYIGSNGNNGATGAVINSYKPSSLIVENCHFEGNGQAGIVIVSDDNATSAKVTIQANAINNCRTAIQLNHVLWDPNVNISWNQISGDANTQRNDQISIYYSYGQPGHLISIDHNFIECNPDAPQYVNSAGIQASDSGSYYVRVIDNVVLNGNQSGISLWNPNNNTSEAVRNYVVGIGYKIGSGYGLGVWTGAGYAIGNVVGWINGVTKTLLNFEQSSLSVTAANTSLPRSSITLQEEQSLYWMWSSECAGAGVNIGASGYANPAIIYPQPSDFPP